MNATVPILKISPGVRLKDLPLEHKVALRLVTLANQQKKAAQVRQIAQEIGAEFMPTMLAVTSLDKQGIIKITPITANDFEFEVDAKNRGALQLPASNYNKHLAAQVQRAERAKTHKPHDFPPPHLPPITAEQRAPWMTKAAGIVGTFGIVDLVAYPKLPEKVANCIARIGEAEVDKLVADALVAAQTKTVTPLGAFFRAYETRRDELIPPVQEEKKDTAPAASNSLPS